MYFIERGIWAIQNDPEERGELEANMARALKKEKVERERGDKPLPGIHDRVSEHPCADGSIYAFNDTYIEIYAGALQDKRGVITVLTLMLGFIIWTFGSLSIGLGTVWFTGTHYWLGRPAIAMDYIASVLIGLLVLGICWAVHKFLWRFIRLENFVQRRLLIRFNRVTDRCICIAPATPAVWPLWLGTRSPRSLRWAFPNGGALAPNSCWPGPTT